MFGNSTVQVRYEMLDTGYCLASEHHMMQGGRRTQIECHSLVALLHHPSHGWGLWDTGYAPRMLAVTRRWPYRLYRYITPLRTRPEQAAVTQLNARGLTADDISWIILSHMHADHTAGLLDFPHATIYMTAAAYHDATSRQGWQALRRAILPDLLPGDFARRTHLIDAFPDAEIPTLGPCYDLWGDGSLRLVALPGHACGQVGMLANTTRGPVLFAADACWLTEAIHKQRLPHPITYLLVDDQQALATSLERLHAFMTANPTVRIIPTHCPAAFAREVVAAEPAPWTAGNPTS